jgi:hypothetical protein
MNKCLSRAGQKWHESEDEILMEQVKNKTDIDLISKNHKRSVSAIKSRIISNSLFLVEKHNMSIDELSKNINISIEDIERHIEFKKRDDKLKCKKEDMRTILLDIRNLLTIIANEYTINKNE